MGKLIKIVVLFFAFWFIIALLGAGYFFRHVGDLRPALLPASNSETESNNSQVQTQGTSTDQNLENLTPARSLQVNQGFAAYIFTDSVSGARDLQITPGGNLLVSSPNTGKVFAFNLQDAEPQPKEILNGLNKPHGLAFYNGSLFVAQENQVTRYRWDEQNFHATLDRKIVDLPTGGSGLHHTRSIVFDQQGRLFISVGSTCNVCSEKNSQHGTVLVTDENGQNLRIYSKGLRNAVFLTLNSDTNQIWVTDMGRDNLGDDLPPDEVNILQENGNFGWPYCYGQKTYDQNFGQQSAEYCQNTIAPVFEIPAHSAPLGLTFIDSAQFPTDWQGDVLVAYHGSWNRSVPDGYKVVHLKRSGNQITSTEDFLTGFLNGKQAYGRPVDLTFDESGNLYISDDKAGRIYKIVKQ